MSYNDKNFIESYDGVFSKDWCERVIKFYEFKNSINKTYGRELAEINSLKKQDNSCNLIPINTEELNFTDDFDFELVKYFTETFWGKCYTEYKNKYNSINALQKHGIVGYKIQKTLPSQGYHVWHSENDGTPTFKNRLLVYNVYLNDVDEGGETEFLYQSLRVKPKQGTCCIFPASFTHTHRGNPPLSGEKYIMTGWIEFI